MNWLLTIRPSLLPLAAILFSFLNSWHCAVMCGPILSAQQSHKISRTFFMRLISYTLLGAIFGYFGELLKNSLEMELIGAISFSIFTLVSLIFVFPFLFPKLRKISPLTSFTDIRGVLWGLVPCHLLYFYYGVAILSGSSVTGALLLFVHATMSAPALLFLSATAQRFYKKSGVVSIATKSVLVILLTFNLIYFWLVFTNGKEIAEKLIMNCF